MGEVCPLCDSEVGSLLEHYRLDHQIKSPEQFKAELAKASAAKALKAESRFRIAQKVSANKGTSNVRPMFKAAQERAGKKPKVLISDGAANFTEAMTKEWWTQKREGRVIHVADTRLSGQVNNKMERQNGEWRDREKAMRSLKREDSPVLVGIQIFHKYFRPHMGLHGKTPVEAAGIKIEGKNPMLTVIQNEAKHLEADRVVRNLDQRRKCYLAVK